jgi:hypothetical protein
MYRSKLFLLLLVSFVLFSESAFAAPKKTTSIISGNLSEFVKAKIAQPAHSKRSFALSLPPTFTVEVPKHGKVRISFISAQEKDWDASFKGSNGSISDNKVVTLFKGVAKFIKTGEEVPAAGSVFKVNGVPQGNIHFGSPKTNSPALDSNERDLFEIKFLVSESGQVTANAEIWLATKSDFEGKTCGEPEPLEKGSLEKAPQSLKRLATTTLPVGLKTLELATEADKEWFDQFGVSSNAQIATIVNAANVIYERDLNLSLNIKSQNVQTSTSQPYTSTNANTLLDQFRVTNTTGGNLGTADAYHLFTGKEMDGSTVGLAWVGVVCSFPTYSYGLTQHLSSALDYVIFAHELGHNLDADHDSSTPPSVMYPSVGSTQTTFSALSMGQIGSHISANGSCLASGTATPTPTATASPTATPTSAPTSAPTPEPTAEPTVVPTAEPTSDPRSGPDPLNPDDGLPSPDTTALNVKSAYSKTSGRAELIVTLSGEKNARCKFNVQLADNLQFRKAKSFALTQVARTRVIFQSKTSVRNSREKVYARAIYAGCGGTTVLSETAEFSPFTTRMKIKESASKWIRRF